VAFQAIVCPADTWAGMCQIQTYSAAAVVKSESVEYLADTVAAQRMVAADTDQSVRKLLDALGSPV
jgi:hypothetical protein